MIYFYYPHGWQKDAVNNVVCSLSRGEHIHKFTVCIKAAGIYVQHRHSERVRASGMTALRQVQQSECLCSILVAFTAIGLTCISLTFSHGLPHITEGCGQGPSLTRKLKIQDFLLNALHTHLWNFAGLWKFPTTMVPKSIIWVMDSWWYLRLHVRTIGTHFKSPFQIVFTAPLLGKITYYIMFISHITHTHTHTHTGHHIHNSQYTDADSARHQELPEQVQGGGWIEWDPVRNFSAWPPDSSAVEWCYPTRKSCVP